MVVANGWAGVSFVTDASPFLFFVAAIILAPRITSIDYFVYCVLVRDARILKAMVRFRLDELLNDRGWTDYRLAQESGIGANVIGKYHRNLVRRPDLTIVSRLCEALQCSIGDLMEYIPDRKTKKR